MTTYFKLLKPNGKPAHGGRGTWDLPKNGKPGKWFTVTGEIVPCENGIHAVTAEHILEWPAEELYVIELGGRIVPEDSKVAARKGRLLTRCEGWNERNLRLFAADCAERALHLYEKQYPGDTRPRDCIAVARRYANGDASADELAAAGAAAWDAAVAAGAAAGAAAWAAAGAAAWDAAWAAAWAAAGAAAWDAAWAAVAAGDAGDAAWAAGDARAAGDAAWAARAAGAAAGAARAAAVAAESNWQLERLGFYVPEIAAAMQEDRR